ncbi:related to FAD dependent oxidoreductase [Phialocephala subalpina]|uniref:Related to FAD dependent oxidoreductase n=1 Tax=Phialocephala subalpina TaxID=576137 RepID=A0A1L7XG40_9HELO|nr:related to FAD dependent oxidoreductase [Phialocephala subalpina]
MTKLISLVGCVLPLLLSSVSASTTCETIAATTNITIEYPLSLSYSSDQFEYWSSDCGRLLPSCIFVPSTSSEVSTIIQILNANNESFAIKAGGHNPNQYYSSIDGGPLINLKGLNEVVYDAATGTAKVGPGNRWTDVVKALEPDGVTVVGGRIGHVGVGGYILGGGLSYLSTQYGWAMNNVAEFEVVLANGTIVTASPFSNPELYTVLKGGGNNFGVVTTYTLFTHPIGTIWGGILIFGSDKTEELLLAIRNFTAEYENEKSAIIATNEITLATLVNIWAIFLFYDGAAPPAGTFDMFTSLSPTLDTTGPQNYSAFVSAEDSLVITGQIYTIMTEMSPLPDTTNGYEVMKAYHDQWYNVTMSNALVTGLVATMAWQPLPKRLAAHALSQGGDLLALSPDVDRILMEVDFSYDLPTDDTQINAGVKEIFTGLRSLEQGFVKEGKLEDAYVPLFMNDANFQQDYWGRLSPGTAEFARAVRDEVDPRGLFRERTGGFKM